MITRFHDCCCSWWTALAAATVVVLTAGRSAAQSPSDFLRRLDTNGNGMIDPSELEGRAGFFIRRLAEGNSRIDLSRPIPLDRISEEFNRMREERSRSGGGPGRDGPPGGGPWGGGPPSGGPPGGGPPGGHGGGSHSSSSSSSSSSRTTKVEPLVPGFGTTTQLNPAPPFGAQSDLFRVQVTDDDRREAEQAFRYYDRNADGKIDASETSLSPRGADLMMYDKNRDGVITLNEMEYRFARRRLAGERESAGHSGRGDSGNRQEGGRGAAPDGVRGDGRSPASRDSANDTSGARKTFVRKSAAERLPDGLPEWFARSDTNGDAQVALHEFAESLSDSVLADFNQFDLNRDGLITPQEALRAKGKGAERASTTAAAAPGAPAAPAATVPQAAAVDPRYRAYAKKLIEKYDTNKDGELTRDEWTKAAKNPEAADADHNGRITAEEYARWSMQ